jgi:alkylation response protein AidB-like acyl-CoA dehydrogenase
VEFEDDPSISRFRDEVRGWLSSHLVGEYRALGTSAEMGAHDWPVRVRWEQELGRAGWLGLTWPKEFGGRAASVAEELAFAQEYALADGPQRAGFFGEGLLGPTLITFGSPEQQERFLPPILRGEEYWCQGFSEPGAGSDLASVRTTAVLDGNTWRVDGQKVWTSQAQFAQWIFVLCRTELDQVAHKALSYVLVPIDQPGVEVRPLKDLSGNDHFCEVFFDGAVTAADLVVGGRGNGWRTAMGTLGFERGTAFMAQQLKFAKEFAKVRELAEAKGVDRDPEIRQRLARAYAELEIMRWSGLRNVTRFLQGGQPGPEGSIGKLFWSKWHQRLGELEADLLGADALVLQPEGTVAHDFQHTFMFSRSHTIYAGSSEIQRNIIGERVLGLPRE